MLVRGKLRKCIPDIRGGGTVEVIGPGFCGGCILDAGGGLAVGEPIGEAGGTAPGNVVSGKIVTTGADGIDIAARRTAARNGTPGIGA